MSTVIKDRPKASGRMTKGFISDEGAEEILDPEERQLSTLESHEETSRDKDDLVAALDNPETVRLLALAATEEEELGTPLADETPETAEEGLIGQEAGATPYRENEEAPKDETLQMWMR